ncbi:MAG: carbamoyltransferase HypF [Candidatus Solincola sediminis]|uniref:Carbamoyltransferase n=1 Tax=Candidatus Solincola sediminis TaxID=1797199 RepID=A0A1F2WF97_9ACTN|nr:MAG: carbamoyltransferase HypF [Candidatus Solincola sediminis]
MLPDEPQYGLIEVRGIVQGVGFRPFVYRLAGNYGIKGNVTNTSEGVRIRAAASSERMRGFIRALSQQAPPQAWIEDISWKELPAFEVEDFTISSSLREAGTSTLISPDLATCDDCLAELFDPNDRRYRYPFINCTNCGPRFTIIEDTPYDRPMTTMAGFKMCERCEEEYHDPANRRFHAQPDACPECGPRLWLADEGGSEIAGDPIELAAELLRNGKIVAIKGLGGFQLACDATSGQAVAGLRERKRRYSKPLAVMVSGLEEARRICRVSEEEARLLASPGSPIVLLNEKINNSISREVAEGLEHQGVFLPYTPLHHLLLREAGIPLVMTSGNMSSEPICKDNLEALERLAGIADYFLLHDRDILIRYDDSVSRIFAGAEYPLRRARGYAPYPVKLKDTYTTEVIALGAELKNTFCFLRGSHAFIGQHIGEMDTGEALSHYEEARDAMQHLFRLDPQVVAHDLHPDYLTTRLAMESSLPRIGVQHHHAHIVSCMADNDIQGEVIGVAWDGTGYGEDGTVWGGEFLFSDRAHFRRAARLRPYLMPGGEICISDISRMAAGVLWEVGESDGIAEELAAQLRSGFNCPLTSSAGRMFDAAAAIIGLRDKALYEGQAACELEAVAKRMSSRYPYHLLESNGLLEIDTRPLFKALIDDVASKAQMAEIAGRFHTTLTAAIVETCSRLSEETGLERIALSGGVFQNELLTSMVLEGLSSAGLECYLHHRVPCNDGGISLGQAVVAAERCRPSPQIEVPSQRCQALL